MVDFLILIQKLHGKECGDVNGIHHTCGNNSIQHRPSIRADFGVAVSINESKQASTESSILSALNM